MGIDIYARWTGQTDGEQSAQITGFSILHGHVGYLREAYHGGPYATRVLVPEAFEDEAFDNDPPGARIPASVLRDRLEDTLAAVAERARNLYRDDEAGIAMAQDSFRDFVRLCEEKERETGEPCLIYASY